MPISAPTTSATPPTNPQKSASTTAHALPLALRHRPRAQRASLAAAEMGHPPARRVCLSSATGRCNTMGSWGPSFEVVTNARPTAAVTTDARTTAHGTPASVVDVVLAAVGLLLATPVLALSALAIRLTGRGP